MAEFEAATETGNGAIAMTQSVTLVIDGIGVERSEDRMRDEAVSQSAGTPNNLFRAVCEHRPDQHEELESTYGSDVVDEASILGN